MHNLHAAVLPFLSFIRYQAQRPSNKADLAFRVRCAFARSSWQTKGDTRSRLERVGQIGRCNIHDRLVDPRQARLRSGDQHGDDGLNIGTIPIATVQLRYGDGHVLV